MRHVLFITIAAGSCLTVMGCIAVVKGGGGDSQSQPAAPASARERGTLEPIASLDRDITSGSEVVTAEVRYINDTGRALTAVTIWCRAVDRAGYERDSRKIQLLSDCVGPMAPGFKAKRSLSFQQPPGVVAAIVCDVTSVQ